HGHPRYRNPTRRAPTLDRVQPLPYNPTCIRDWTYTMPGVNRKLFKELMSRASKQGWEVSKTASGHYRLKPTDPNARLIFLPHSASDARAWMNALKECERAGLDVTGLR